MLYMGSDPGKSGATAFLCEGELWWVKHSETPHDITREIVTALARSTPGEVFAIIESVHAMPGQGVSSTFKFGQSYGFLLGLLTALSIPYETVTPRKWQSYMGCLTRGDKNVSKSRAQELFPDVKVTHAIADAILIAEYNRRTRE